MCGIKAKYKAAKKPTEDHKSALNRSKYEMEKCQTIQTLLTATTEKINIILCLVNTLA